MVAGPPGNSSKRLKSGGLRLQRRFKSSDFASILLIQRELFGIGVFFVFQIPTKSEAIETLVETGGDRGLGRDRGGAAAGGTDFA